MGDIAVAIIRAKIAERYREADELARRTNDEYRYGRRDALDDILDWIDEELMWLDRQLADLTNVIASYEMGGPYEEFSGESLTLASLYQHQRELLRQRGIAKREETDDG